MSFQELFSSITTLLQNLPAGRQGKKRLFGADYKQTALLKQGREQFKALIQKGLVVPVVLL